MSSPHLPADPGRRAAAVGRNANLDSPLKTIVGLLILWGSLMLIFKAHRISDSEIRLENGPAAARQTAASKSPGPLLDSCEVTLLKDFSPRDALNQVAQSLGLDVGQEELNKLAQSPKAFEIKGAPLYKALHTLIADHTVGYSLQGRTLRLFDQKLESQKKLLNWEAELPLTDAPLAIFPSGDFDLWFSIQLIRDNANLQDPWRKLHVELWKGGEHRNTATQALNNNGQCTIGMSSNGKNGENISFQIERRTLPKGRQTPGRYRMIFTYQTFE